MPRAPSSLPGPRSNNSPQTFQARPNSSLRLPHDAPRGINSSGSQPAALSWLNAAWYKGLTPSPSFPLSLSLSPSVFHPSPVRPLLAASMRRARHYLPLACSCKSGRQPRIPPAPAHTATFPPLAPRTHSSIQSAHIPACNYPPTSKQCTSFDQNQPPASELGGN